MTSKRVRLAQRRRSAGFSQEKLAIHLGVDRTTVVRWEAAEADPQPWTRPKLARALGVSTGELEALLDDVVIVQAAPNERMNYVLEHPTSADLVSVAYLHERTRQLDESYDQSPSTALLGPAGQVHGQVRYLRENARDARVRKALHEVEAEAATFMGQLIWDVSQRRDHAGAMTYFDEAIQSARVVRDPTAESYAVLRKSYVALYGEKDAIRGAMLAQEASEVAKLGSPALVGLGLIHVAEGYAMVGDLKRSEDALKKAESQLGRSTPDDVAAEYYTVNEYNRLVGSCYLYLGLPDRAELILRDGVAALAGKKKSQAIALGNLSLSLIRQRQCEEAAATLHRAIDAVEITRGGGGLNLVFQAGRELRDWRTEVWVQDIHDRLLALMAAI
ncbi:helix-turn-helix domain-containing protein [Streptomyces sp. NPDC003688]